MTIYLDMDGVLADFVQHTINLNIPNNHQWFEPRETWTEETLAGERIKIAAMHSPGFWNTLPIMPGGKELWDFCRSWVGQQGVQVLTCKPKVDSPSVVAEEKFQWINESLGPISVSKFNCVAPGDKRLYLKAGDLLVDDDLRHMNGTVEGVNVVHHTAEYVRNGNSIRVVQYPDVIQTINKIKEIYA